MMRSRLALAFAMPLLVVLVSGIAIHRGYANTVVYLDQAESIVEGLERFEELSRLSDRLVLQQLAALLDDRPPNAAVEPLRQRVEAAIHSLRVFVARDKTIFSSGDREPISVELALTPRISAVLESVMDQLAQADHWRQQGRQAEATALVSRVLAEDLERRLNPWLDAAIAVQRDHSANIRQTLSSSAHRMRLEFYALLLMMSALTAAAGYWVFRSIETPLGALTVGTQAISAGNLAWRIPVKGSGQLTDLARHFNQMARELEQQHHALLEQQMILETKVMERTRQLHDLNAELQRLDKLRRQFFADISHELKTPLTVIRGEAEVTLRGREKEGREYRECLQRVRELAVQLDRLVSELLFLARAESGHLQFEWSILEFGDMAASVVDDLRVLAQAKSISVIWIRPDRPAWVKGDRSRLHQALLVIGDNACRYSPTGSEITLSLAVSDQEVRFAVADQGIGIPQEDLAKIFDRYFRSANARRSSAEGTGLGLPVAQSIVKTHGGRIAVTSNPEAGTVFSIVLPLAESDDGTSDGVELSAGST